MDLTVAFTYALAQFGAFASRMREGDPDVPTPRLHGDRGAVSTEMVIIIAGLAALALAVVAIIAAKVNDKASNIPT